MYESKIESNFEWLTGIDSRIKTVYLEQLTYKGAFCQVLTEKDKSPKRPVGIWGFNTWAGLHAIILLGDEKFRETLRNTFEYALKFTEDRTGLLPHAINGNHEKIALFKKFR